MAEELNPDLASELARSLKTIDAFPWDADTIKATAEDLIRWCTGSIVDGQRWPPEAQARWTVTQARDNWEKWMGTAELRKLFRSKFEAQPVASNAVTDYANLPCVCGSGEKFKACCMGKPMPPLDLGKVKTITPRPVGRRTAEDQARLDQIAEDIARVEAEREKGA